MTKENQKKLYDHYVGTGQKERAAEILKSWPEFKEPNTASTSRPDPVSTASKSKGKK